MNVLGIIIGIVAILVAAFLVVFGAIVDKPDFVASGMTVIGASMGSLITYFFTKQEIEKLKNKIQILRRPK